MKRCLSLLLGLVLLCTAGCAANRSYLSVTPHEEQYVTEENADALVVSDYEGLTSALLLLVNRVEPSGLIRVYSYEDGEVSTDIAQAVYQVAKQTALGTYAVDYITYDCSQVVSYYEISVDITYTKTRQQIEALITTRGQNAVKTRIAGAMEHYMTELAMYVYSFEDFDIMSYIAEYYEQHPATVQALPEVKVARYPQSGSECILELQFTYPESPELMQSYQAEVEAVTDAAVEYVQYRDSEADKLQLLYFYLSERFDYVEQTTQTPVYSVLCEGKADSVSIARTMQILCDALGLECWTVVGSCNAEPWCWNIVRLDRQYYHIDAMRGIRAGDTELPLNLDSAMTDYSWETENYPACTLRPNTGVDLRGEEDGSFDENVLPGS